MGISKEDIHSTSGVLPSQNKTGHMTQEASFPTTNQKEASRRKSLPKRHLGVLDVGCYGFQGSTNQKRTKIEWDKHSDTEDSQVRCWFNCVGDIIMFHIPVRWFWIFWVLNAYDDNFFIIWLGVHKCAFIRDVVVSHINFMYIVYKGPIRIYD